MTEPGEAAAVAHPDAGRLQALLDDALASGESATLREHLERCTMCHERLEELRVESADVSAALRLLDVPPPTLSAAAIRRRAARRRALGSLTRAAAIVLLAAAGAAALAPGSPVRDWIASAWHSLATPETPSVEAAPSVTGGVRLRPAGDRLDVHVVDAEPSLRLRVVWSAADVASARATGGGEVAGYEASGERLLVRAGSADELEVTLPRMLRSTTVLVNGRELVRKRGDELVVSGAAQQVDSVIHFAPASGP